MKDKINRRELLKTTAMTGVGLGSIGIFSGNIEASSSREYIPIEGEARAELISQIKSNPDVQELANTLKNENRSVEYTSGKYTRIIPESESPYKIAVLPLSDIQGENSREQAAIKWDSRSSESPVAYTLETSPDQKPTAKEHNINDSIGPDADTPIDGGGGDCATFTTESCTNFDLTCITWIIASIGLSCATMNPVACLAGSTVALGPYTTGDGCDPCDNYEDMNKVYC